MRQDNSSSRLWRIIYPILTYFGVYYLIFIIGGIFGVTFSVVSMKQSGAELDYYVLLEQTALWIARHQSEMQIAVSVIVLPLAMLYFRMDQKSAGLTGKKEAPLKAPVIVTSILLGVSACMALNGLLNMSGLMRVYEENLDEIGQALYQGRIFWEILGTGLLAPLVEELIFRGLIFRRLKDWVAAPQAIVVSALIFGFYHGNTLQIIYASVIGLLFAWLYEKYKNLIAPILAHMAANLFSVIASESGMLDQLLAKEGALIAFTGVSCLLLLGCIYLLQEKFAGR